MEATLATLAASVSPVAPLPGVGAGLPPGAFEFAGWLAAGAVPGVFGIDLLGGDDGGDDGADDGEGDDAVFEEGSGDDLGDLGELDDEGFGGFDDEGDGLGGDGGDVSELENRLEELETEVGSLSSSVNTVQTENEAVSETVAEVEENVRDLLEIYEMVTRGVNPFVDEAASGAMGGDVGGDFGLFDDDGGGGGGDVDDSIADADAEEFFEDDFGEPGGDLADPDDAAVLDGEDLDDGLESDVELEGPADDDTPEEPGDDADDDGKSFEELKQEYESGEAGWDIDDPAEDVDDPAEDIDDPIEDDETGAQEVDPPGDGPLEDEASEDPSDAFVFEGAEADDGEFEFVGEGGSDDGDAGDTEESRLHLAAFPDGYVADLTALEWLEYLIDVGGKSGARDALAYYVDVDWISPQVEDELNAFLDGIRVSGANGAPPDPGGLARFDPEHHRRSLAYVARLAGDGDRAAVLDRIDGSAGVDGPATPAQGMSPVADGGGPGADAATGGDDDGI